MSKQSSEESKKEDLFYSQIYDLFEKAIHSKDELSSFNELLFDLYKSQRNTFYPPKLNKTQCGRKLLELSKEEIALLIEAGGRRLIEIDEIARNFLASSDGEYYSRTSEGLILWKTKSILRSCLSELMRKKLPFSSKQIDVLLSLCERSDSLTEYGFPIGGIVKCIEDYHKVHSISDSQKTQIEGVVSVIRESHDNQDLRKYADRLETLLGKENKIPIQPGEAWSDQAINDLSELKTQQQQNWAKLLIHCRSASAGKPSKKWLEAANELLQEIDIDQLSEFAETWFPLIDKPRTEPRERIREWEPDPNLLIIKTHMDILKGLAWCSSLIESESLARSITQLAMTSYKKVPGVGPRAVKVGNACVYALGVMENSDSVGQLALLKIRTKFKTAQNLIEKALLATAERTGIPREELEEMSVPAYGLTDVGMREEPMGEVTALLQFDGKKGKLTWRKADGKVQKSVPANIKVDFAEDLKEIKAALKDIEKMLPAQSARIEQTYLQEKTWSFETWKERYLDHPLVGILSRNLIWQFEQNKQSVSAIWTNNGFVDQNGKPLDGLETSSTVQLWHPIFESDVGVITAWREWLLNNEVKQPFKQAHREIYLLTDAERNTRVYSNRFAAHIIKQHQYNALCGARGWRNSLRLMVDDECPPTTLNLTNWNLRAEFWVEAIGDEYGTDTNETGTFYYLVTDQVRFYHIDAAENSAHAGGGGYSSNGIDEEENHPLELEQIDPLVFSEVMRDVDLFVGVASVGNDPNWSDGGPEGRFLDYWQSYSFGELNSSANTRKTVLENLIPRLKIAERCSFLDRFLVVRGDIRTYKIHLGSGNILMEPSDQYLCIVPKQSPTKKSENIFLPFDGDKMLSIILSKAMLLAEDTKIKDPTIISQIKM